MTLNRDKYAVLDKFETTTFALHAFNEMLTRTIEQGEDFSFISSGVFHLLKSQISSLESIQTDVRREYNKADDLAKVRSSEAQPTQPMPGADYYRQNQLLIARLASEGKQIEEIATLTGLASERVRIFIDAMPAHVFEEAKTADPMTLRSDIISEKIRDGYDVAEIAQALNLKRSTVERVIGQLRGRQAEGSSERRAS